MLASTSFNEPAPETSAQWINRGHRLQHEGQYTDALSAYEQAIVCNPQDTSAYAYLADACKKLGKYEFALAAYQRALDLNPTSLSLYFFTGDALKNLHRYEEALAVFEQAIALFPEDGALYALKADVLAELQREQEALVTFAQTLQLCPQDAGVYNNSTMLFHTEWRSLSLWKMTSSTPTTIRSVATPIALATKTPTSLTWSLNRLRTVYSPPDEATRFTQGRQL